MSGIANGSPEHPESPFEVVTGPATSDVFPHTFFTFAHEFKVHPSSVQDSLDRSLSDGIMNRDA